MVALTAVFVIVEQPGVAGTQGRDGTELKTGLNGILRIEVASL